MHCIGTMQETIYSTHFAAIHVIVRLGLDWKRLALIGHIYHKLHSSACTSKTAHVRTTLSLYDAIACVNLFVC